MKKYDYIVVGSGCAGLAASCELALNGKKVLLIEQHNIPGGCATGFVRGRFEFEPSLHELCSLGPAENPGSVRRLFDRYGVKVEWNRVDDCFRVISTYSDGTPMDVSLPAGNEAFKKKLEYYVPGCKEAVDTMFELFDQVTEGVDYVSEPGYNMVKLMVKYTNLLKVGAHDCMSVFKAIHLPQKVIDIMATYWSYLGVDMESLSFPHYVCMVKHYIESAAYIPSYTSHEISVGFIERFRAMGGETLFNCRAEEFIFKGDKCCGVKTNLGTFEADCVLANINPDIIYGSMMDKKLIPEREKKLSAARDRKMGARMFTTYLGLNKTAEELGIKDYSIFLSGTADSKKEYESQKKIDTNDYSIFLCYNIANPHASPEDTSICSFTTMFTSAEDWNNVEGQEYFDLKEKIARKFLASLKEKAGIDLEPYIEEISIASPLTFARYIGVPEGSVYGYETRDWDDIFSRSMSIAQDYPINGLLPIGTSGARGDGYSSALLQGKMMAAMALKKYGKGGNK